MSELAAGVASSTTLPNPREATSGDAGSSVRDRPDRPSTPTPEHAPGDLLCVSTWGRPFAVPVDAVAEVFPLVAVEPILGSATSVVGLIRMGGRSIPVHDLGILLGVEATGFYTLDTVMVVIEADRGRRMVIVVDPEVSFMTANEINTEEPLPTHFTQAPIRGVAVIGMRQLSVLDADALLASTDGSSHPDRPG